MAAKDPTTTPIISSVRVKQGGVHFTGARTVHLLTTDREFVSVAGNTTVVCDTITTVPTGDVRPTPRLAGNVVKNGGLLICTRFTLTLAYADRPPWSVAHTRIQYAVPFW